MRLFGKRKVSASNETPIQKPTAEVPTPQPVETLQDAQTGSQLGNVTELRQQLESDIQNLNDQYSDIRANLKSRLFSEKELLRSHGQQLEKQQLFLQVQQKDADAAVKMAQKALATSKETHQQAVDKQNKLITTQKDNNQQMADLSARITTEQAKMQQLNDSQKAIAKNLHGEQNLDELVAAFNRQKQAIEQITTQKGKLNFEIAELMNRENQCQIQQSTLKDELAENEQLLTDVIADQKKLATDLDKKGTLVAQLTNQLAVVGHQVNENKAQLKAVDTKLTFYFHSAKVIRAFTFSHDRSYYIYSNVLPPLTDLATTGGWQRIDQLFDKLNLRYKVLTTSFDSNLSATWRDYQTRQLLPNAGGVVNPYWKLLQRKISMERHVQAVDVEGQWQVTERSGDQPVTMVSPDKQELAQLTYRRDQSLMAIQYFHNGQLYQVAVYDTDNQLLATELVDAHQAGHVASETFYNQAGRSVLQKIFLEKGPMFQTLGQTGTIQRNYYSDLNFEVEQLKHQLLTQETDSLIIGSESPLFRALLHDPERHFELIPLITTETSSDLVEQITRADSPISSVLTIDKMTKQFLIDKADRDLNIAVLPDKEMNQGRTSRTNVMTAVELPKMS